MNDANPEPVRPDALVFDVYGTLLDVASVEATCQTVVPEPAAFVGLWRRKQLEYTWNRALMGRYADFENVTSEALDHVAELSGVRLDPALRQRLMDAWTDLRMYPEVVGALDRLAPRPLAVLSNGTPRMLEEVLARAGLGGRFAHVLSVDAVRTYKPDPAVYELAERALGLTRDRLLFVSANGWDAAGATAFGLPTAWVNRGDGPPDRLGTTPDLEVRDLAELADRID